MKKALSAVAFLFVIATVLMFLVYDFKITYMNVSNVVFILGVLCFFPGLILASGAMEIFSGFNYLASKTFSGLFNFSSRTSAQTAEGGNRNNGRQFKSFSEYLKFKNNHHMIKHTKDKGLIALTTGSLLIVVSLVLNTLS